MSHPADRVAAIATGIGVGVIAFMLTWTIGARITEQMLERPTSAYVAMATALVVCVVVSVVAVRRLQRSVNRSVQQRDDQVAATS